MTDTDGIVPDGPMAPGGVLAHFLGTVPDGAVITTDPETAGVVHDAASAAGRQVTIVAYASRHIGTVRASWDGPADGEHHELETWV